MKPAIERAPEIAALAAGADFVDLRGVRGEVAFTDLLMGILTYQPAWIAFLFRCRSVLAWLLGLEDAGTSTPPFTAEQVMHVGEAVDFFKVFSAAEEHHWIGVASDKHLNAYLTLWAESSPDGTKRYWTSTIVHYKHWTGPVYFNIIRPFHHLIVNASVRHICKRFGLTRV